MIRIIATTISNSISEKPFCFRMSLSPVDEQACPFRYLILAAEVPHPRTASEAGDLRLSGSF
jgi:hypothetical protein